MSVEIERKFRLPEGGRIRALDGVTLGAGDELSLRAVYFDTPDLVLARRGITLRRRTGGHDEGWHLKLPGEGHAREEIGAEILPGASTTRVPHLLRSHVADVVKRAPLVPVARLDTARRETPLLDEGGTTVALLCEDQVTVRRGTEEHAWQEVEVELTPAGHEGDLDAISRALEAQGAQAQPATSKLVQALGSLLTQRTEDQPRSAAQVIGDYLATQVGMVQAMEPEVRADAPDAVHKLRVACRRLRSVLRVYRALMDAERTEPLRTELKWLGEVLGGPRDAEVLRERLHEGLDLMPDEGILGPVRERLATELDARHAAAHAAMVAALDEERYAGLLEALTCLLTDPPFLPGAERPARQVLPRHLDRATRRVSMRWAAACAAKRPEKMELAHEARKKAKASRYAWEAAIPALPNAERAAAAWKQVTESLGVAQDTVVSRARLLELTAAAAEAGEPTFTYGVLYGRELSHQDDARGVADRAVRIARRASRTH